MKTALWRIMLVVLVSNTYLNSCDSVTKKMILNARTPASLEDTHGVTELDLNNKNTTDETLTQILVACSSLVKISAQHHLLNAPQPHMCPFLAELDFSHGTLKAFPIGAFIEHMPLLKKLNLSHNAITTIKSENDASQRTDWFTDAKRPWHSSVLDTVLVSDNQLTEIDLRIINNAPSLVVADFSNNKITTVQTPYLFHRETCTAIKLSNNLLDDTQKELLTKANILPSLTHSHNRSTGLLWGFLIGAAGGATLCPGLVLGLSLPIIYVSIIVPSLAGGLIIGGAIGGSIGNCVTSKDERTCSPCVLDFGESKNQMLRDDTTIDLATSV